MLIGQTEVTAGRVEISRNFRHGPARNVLARRTRGAVRHHVARVVEVNEFFEALEVAVFSVRFHKPPGYASQ